MVSKVRNVRLGVFSGGGCHHPNIGVATFFFFFFFFEPGVKLDEKSIENGLEGQTFLVVCLFWGGCHHPNVAELSCSSIYRLSSILIFCRKYVC